MSVVEEYEYIARRMAELNSSPEINSVTPNAYPIWQLPVGEYVFRFLPDGNADNPFFWVSKPNYHQDVRGPAIFQGFVHAAPDGVDVPRNMIQKIIIPGTAMLGLINGLYDPDLMDEALPCDYDAGRDFVLFKRKIGPNDAYDYVRWKAKPRSLTDAERTAITSQGLANLRSWL